MNCIRGPLIAPCTANLQRHLSYKLNSLFTRCSPPVAAAAGRPIAPGPSEVPVSGQFGNDHRPGLCDVKVAIPGSFGRSVMRVFQPHRLAANPPLSFDDADIGQVAVFFGIVDAVAGNEYVADGEADKIKLDFDLPPLRLIEKRAGPEVADPALPQQGGGTGDGSAGIDNVVDEQHPPSRKVGRDVAEELHFAAAYFGKAVAAQPHKLDLGMRPGPIQRACEVSDKHCRTLEQSNDDEIVRDHPRDLGGERLDLRSDLRL